MILAKYKNGTVFQLLLKGCEVAEVVEDWYYQNVATDIRVRRAKTKDCTVIETTDVLFASRTLQSHPGIKVNIKEP